RDRAGSNATSAGPRNTLQERFTTLAATSPIVVRGARVLFSSVPHTESDSGSVRVALIICAIPLGGPEKGIPPALNLMTGAPLPLASLKGATTHNGFKFKGIEFVCPFDVIVQVRRLSPKSFGTVIVNTPHCLRGRKCVGCP